MAKVLNLHEPQATGSEALRMPFLQHLEELRRRLLYSAVAVVVAFLVSYPFAGAIFDLLILPINRLQPVGEPVRFIYTGPLEVFIAFIKIGLVSGVCVAMPVILLQLWRFIAPALKAKERRLLLPFVGLSTLFFFAGVAFGFVVILPIGYQFFISYAPANVLPQLRVAEYLSVTLKLLLAFGVLFELPVLTLLLIRIGVLKVIHLTKHWRGIVVSIFCLSAFLTPADPLTMVLMALPLLVIFVASVGIGRILERRSSSNAKKHE